LPKWRAGTSPTRQTFGQKPYSSVYLLPDFEDIEEADEWLEDNFLPVLETLLEEWIPDDSWPDRLEFTHLEKYADYSFSNIVIDTVDPSYDEG